MHTGWAWQIPVASSTPTKIPGIGDVISLGLGGANTTDGNTAVEVSTGATSGQFTIMSENGDARLARALSELRSNARPSTTGSPRSGTSAVGRPRQGRPGQQAILAWSDNRRSAWSSGR
jgi:hypothetical protein